MAARGVPAELERLILRALAKDAAMRPTMAELASALTELADGIAEEIPGSCMSWTH